MNDEPLTYDQIRPYHDHEVPKVLQRLGKKPSFFVLMKYLFPEQSGEEILQRFSNIHSVEQFQTEYIRHAIHRILKDSAGEVTIDGLEGIDPNTSYLFLSNHRDIILDSAILNVLLKDSGRRTTKIAIGDNLLVSELVTDLMKLNKSFIVHRNVARQDMMPYSNRLSSYIRDQVTQNLDSVWLAQRNGRTKDGNDQTHAGLLKMLNFSGKGDLEANFKELNIIPMSISYEIDPCDGLKAEERYHQNRGLPYEKDDKQGMVLGIRGFKGRIHLAFGSPLNQWIEDLPRSKNQNAWVRELADALDLEIHSNFRLWSNNFVAADVLEGSHRHQDHYSIENKEVFLQHMKKQLKERRGDKKELRKRFMEIYANPVWNREQ